MRSRLTGWTESTRTARHPKEVTFTALLSEDLKRRDFTINAMAYNEKEGLVDLFGGQKDMEEKVIRCVGDPLERFTEDALRILRGCAFCVAAGLFYRGTDTGGHRILAGKPGAHQCGADPGRAGQAGPFLLIRRNFIRLMRPVSPG